MFGIGKKKDRAEAPAEAPVTAVEMQPAGFWLRVVALIVDYGMLLILLAAMMMGAESVGGDELALPAYWLWVLATFLYWPVLESTAWRGTVGKRLLGVVVGDIDGGGLNFVRSLLRNLAKIISSIPFGIGFLMAAFTSRKQALHDLITKSVVMRKGPGNIARTLGVLVVGIGLLVAGSYVTNDMMMGTVMKDMEAIMGGGVAQPPARPAAKPPAKPAIVAKPAAPAPSAPPAAAANPAAASGSSAAAPAPAPQAAPVQAPAAKPAASPVQIAQAPAPASATPKPAPEAKPAPAPKPVAAPSPAAKPAALPTAKPEPAKVDAAPKAQEPVEAKPAAPPPAPQLKPEPLVPLVRPAAALPPGPRFNDVMTAVLYSDPATVAQLLSLGRWPDKRDSNGLTPLMVAAANGDAAIVQLLLERGADPDLQAPGGATALDFALERGEARTTQLLQRKARR